MGDKINQKLKCWICGRTEEQIIQDTNGKGGLDNEEIFKRLVDSIEQDISICWICQELIFSLVESKIEVLLEGAEFGIKTDTKIQFKNKEYDAEIDTSK